MLVSAAAAAAYLTDASFGRKEANQAAFYAAYCVVCTLALGYFSEALKYAKEVTLTIGGFITKFAPLLETALIMSGKVTSAAAFHPILSTGVYIVSLIVENCLIPLITYGTVLSVVNNMSGAVQISGLCSLINSIAKWILAAAFTVFSGLCGIYGFSAPAIDAMGAKTMKFAVGSLVPVVGGFLSETLETVLGGGAMMKGVIGSAGAAAVAAAADVPCIKLAVMVLMLRVAAAITEPITDKRISKLLNDISGSVVMLFGMVVTISILFVICISIIIGCTS